MATAEEGIVPKMGCTSIPGMVQWSLAETAPYDCYVYWKAGVVLYFAEGSPAKAIPLDIKVTMDWYRVVTASPIHRHWVANRLLQYKDLVVTRVLITAYLRMQVDRQSGYEWSTKVPSRTITLPETPRLTLGDFITPGFILGDPLIASLALMQQNKLDINE
jgi:hypothetical protein